MYVTHSPFKHELPALFPIRSRGMNLVHAKTKDLMRMQFDLVDRKELAPLDELNDAILAEDMKAPR